MEFYTYDGVNLVLPDMAGTFGISQDQASWILTTYISALLFGVPLSIWMAGRVRYLHYIIGSTTRLRSCFGWMCRSAGFPDLPAVASGSRLRRSGIDDVVARRRLHTYDGGAAEHINDANLRHALSCDGSWPPVLRLWWPTMKRNHTMTAITRVTPLRALSYSGFWAFFQKYQ